MQAKITEEVVVTQSCVPRIKAKNMTPFFEEKC